MNGAIVISRLIAFSLFLILAGCSTTNVKSPEPEPEPFTSVQEDLPRGEGDSIDEHLYVPQWFEDDTEVAGPLESQYDNVWLRLVDNFSLPNCDEHKRSLTWTKWYANHGDYMERVMKRAKPWIYFIAEELEARDLPGELALLPIVESAYDPFAYSSGRALGTWQFIAETGKRYGLKQDWWYDGRRDVWSSTHAALDYLEKLNEIFKGDWLLALAGYNAGENRIVREIDRNLKNGKPADFWNLRLPNQTRDYVPTLLGLACLFQNSENYDFAFPKAPNQPVISIVDMQRQSDLVLISQFSGVSIDVLFSLNPGFSRWATSPDGPWHVILPVEGAEKLQRHLQSNPNAALMKWDQVLVEKGDSISSLATRHNVPVEVLRSSNKLTSDMLHPGQKLRLPRDEQLLSDPLYVSAAAELQELQSGLIASERIEHLVRQGEILSVIAKNYKVTVEELQSWNNISDPRKLRAGQTLALFKSPAPAAPVVNNSTVKHTVRNGDSLWSIARYYNVKVSDLMRWNGLRKNAVIQPGQSIKINL